MLKQALAPAPGRGERLLTRAYALMRGLWPSSDESNIGKPGLEVAFLCELRESASPAHAGS